MSPKTARSESDGYNIQITGRHVHVTEGMKKHAYDKIAKIERLTHHIIDVIVTMDIQKLEHRVDIVFKFGHFKIHAEASSNDMYVSIDKAVEKLRSQLQKWKSRIQSHQAKATSVVDMNVNVFQKSRDEVAELNEDIDEENYRELEETYRPHEIVKCETRPLKHLTYDEAIMKMELSGDPFLVFKGEEQQKIKVIYRRTDGCYGVIEPE